MASVKKILAEAAIDTDQGWKALKNQLYFALGGPGPLKIQAYRGYGTTEKLHLKGRVLVDKDVQPASEADTLWENLVSMYKRLNAHPIPGAEVRVRFQDTDETLTTDENGYFDAWIETGGRIPRDRAWHDVDLELVSPTNDAQGPVHETAWVLVPSARAHYVVISDLDDTVVKTGATSVLTLARESFLGNAYTRLPFPGVAAFYRALRDGAAGDARNPLLYVSRSPWNLYDLLSQFFRIHDIPVGPVLFLREWGLSEEGLTVASVRGLKYRLISRMLDLYQDLPFILLGDSGQKDPEIYQALVEQYPGRVLAVYIRNVRREPERLDSVAALAKKVAEQGSTLVLADDSLAMAKHAAEQGWISPARLPKIAGEKAEDEAPPSTLERMLGEDGKAEGRKVDVAPERGAEGTKAAVDRGAVKDALQSGDEAEEETPTVVVSGERSSER